MKVAVVIVTYNANIEDFKKVITSVTKNKIFKVIVVDNASNNTNELTSLVYRYKQIKLIKLDDNFGIAVAHNIGIKCALEKKVDLIWFSDQDTIYPNNYLTNMLQCLGRLKQDKVKVAILGPRIFDKISNRITPLKKNSSRHGTKIQPQDYYSVDTVIASGMLIPSEIFNAIGLNREDLFIDGVDLELCWRARKLGYEVIANNQVTITHNLGDRTCKLFGIYIPLRSPTRHYYMVRNMIYLSLFSGLLPLRSKILEFYCAIRWLLIIPLFSGNIWLNYKYTFKGLWHALTGRFGPIK